MKFVDIVNKAKELKPTGGDWKIAEDAIWQGDFDRPILCIDILSEQDANFILFWYQNHRHILDGIDKAVKMFASQNDIISATESTNKTLKTELTSTKGKLDFAKKLASELINGVDLFRLQEIKVKLEEL